MTYRSRSDWKTIYVPEPAARSVYETPQLDLVLDVHVGQLEADEVLEGLEEGLVEVEEGVLRRVLEWFNEIFIH